MEIITGYTGKKHITAEMDRDVNIGIVGGDSYVLVTGSQLEAEISSNNEIKIKDGVVMHQGCAGSIKKNTYDSITISNGSQGMKRIDLLVLRYERNQDTNIELLTLKVLQGTPAESSPTVPQYTVGDIQSGDSVSDMPLYEIELDGINVTEVRKVFKICMTNADLSDSIIYLNANSKIETSINNLLVVQNGNIVEITMHDIIQVSTLKAITFPIPAYGKKKIAFLYRDSTGGARCIGTGYISTSGKFSELAYLSNYPATGASNCKDTGYITLLSDCIYIAAK